MRKRLYVAHRARSTWAILGVSFALFPATVASPFILAALLPRDTDWARLGNIGQTYGAASAILSVCALCGVLISLRIQARDSATAREINILNTRYDMFKLILENDLYMYAGEPPHGPAKITIEQFRLEVYVNWILNYSAMAFAIGGLSEASLRSSIGAYMDGEVFRNYWEIHGDHWSAPRDRADQDFYAIVSDEHEKAVKRGPAVPARDYFAPPGTRLNKNRGDQHSAGTEHQSQSAAAPLDEIYSSGATLDVQSQESAPGERP